MFKRTPLITLFNEEPVPSTLSEEIEASSSFQVAAVVPSESVPFTLGNGSFSTDEVGPLSVTHFLWSAKAWAPDDTFIALSCLLDTGAHLNCIRKDLVIKLGLKVKLLAKPLSVTLAFNGSSAKHPHLLSDYVEFSLLSKNSDWQSRRCKALVIENLC